MYKPRPKTPGAAYGTIFVSSCVFLILAYINLLRSDGQYTEFDNVWFIAACCTLAFAEGMAASFLEQEWPLLRWLVGATILATFAGLPLEKINYKAENLAKIYAEQHNESLETAILLQESEHLQPPLMMAFQSLFIALFGLVLGLVYGWCFRAVSPPELVYDQRYDP